MRFVGRPVERREDARLLTGRGCYVGDVVRPHALTAAVDRSPHAHALIRRIDTGRARALPGIVACVTVADLGAVAAIPTRLPLRPALHAYLQRPLAADRVRYVGEPVAVVVGADRYVAEDARELVEVDYEALPAVVDTERAVEAGAPPLFPDGNLIEAWSESVGDVASPSSVRRPGPYRLPAYRCRASAVVTNKTPTGTLRAPGFYECSFVRERALGLVAAACGIDPAEVRRRNLITPDRMPYAVGTELAGPERVLRLLAGEDA